MGKPDWLQRRRKAVHRVLHQALNEQRELQLHGVALIELDLAIAKLQKTAEILDDADLLHQV